MSFLLSEILWLAESLIKSVFGFISPVIFSSVEFSIFFDKLSGLISDIEFKIFLLLVLVVSISSKQLYVIISFGISVLLIAILKDKF